MEWYYWLTIYLAAGFFMGGIFVIGDVWLGGGYTLADVLGFLFGFTVSGGIIFSVGGVVAFVCIVLTLLDKIEDLRWKVGIFFKCK